MNGTRQVPFTVMWLRGREGTRHHIPGSGVVSKWAGLAAEGDETSYRPRVSWVRTPLWVGPQRTSGRVSGFLADGKGGSAFL
jgi:hypothetical protein